MSGSDSDPKLEAYSCARCRRLKKKCSRELPICSHCTRSKKECVYPGKAPRRTKKQLQLAEERGEFTPSKRHKLSGSRNGSTSTSNSGTGTNTSPRDTTGTEIMKPIHSSSQPFDNVSSLISVLSSVENKQMNTQGNSATTPQTNATSPSNHDSTVDIRSPGVPVTQYMTPIGLPLSPNTAPVTQNNMQLPAIVPGSTTMGTGASPMSLPLKLDESNKMGLSPKTSSLISNLLSDPRATPGSLQGSSLVNTNLTNRTDPLNHALGVNGFDATEPNIGAPSPIPRLESTPIQAPFFEIETINSVFQGGKKPTELNSNGTFKTLDRNLMDRFIAAYFRHNHRLFPMINKIDFFKRLCKIKEYNFETLGQDFDDLYIFKLYMILAIGCTTLRRAGMLLKDEEELSEHLAYLAMTKFKAVTHLQNMDTIQCHLLLGIYSFFEPKGWSSWTISGIIMRLTIGLGLNRDLPPKKKLSMSASDTEARYRVFWSAYCFERLVATVLGRISAIDDEDITIPLPHALYEGEKEEIDVTNTMISLRKMSGLIYQKVHAVRCGKMNLTNEQKQKIISDIRLQLDEVYEFEKNKMQTQNAKHKDDTMTVISFHSSSIWLAMRYAQLQILLYRPSTLIPKPPIESLSILGDFCLKAWKHTYTLYRKKLLPLNWITLFRTLTICNTILYCLCQWAIDLIESKIEIQQIVEILEHFGAKWVFAKKCAEVFQGISNCILDISLSDGKVPNMDKLTRELFGANDAYHDILDENNLDISWSDKLAL
ncbi:similar to Saccharomyces cerevisiae YHR178W STB5 Transcription factor, involved in regulating multidrug resistance and oxidative stress response [Maudiozyma saulgeensis]|uniref:Similar to Saccharomyces cerevisiae YHR178W STB5 Transcription factor, involved in regulating multidrug resistance and oxidative stress response n=1 Tax=Maudiozyma saulgeensis TaxID=1789683 RepID=A0A1X7R503_9SACH|nr:similar to Saccharomyces cerevisiae YHR178W STB5 Transcription factor, involved in regulating multidrug resistance and oxidative stress response [Kazachstania saulgeensis]